VSFYNYRQRQTVKKLHNPVNKYSKKGFVVGTTITLQRLKKRGYVSLTELHLQLNPSLCEPPST